MHLYPPLALVLDSSLLHHPHLFPWQVPWARHLKQVPREPLSLCSWTRLLQATISIYSRGLRCLLPSTCFFFPSREAQGLGRLPFLVHGVGTLVPDKSYLRGLPSCFYWSTHLWGDWVFYISDAPVLSLSLVSMKLQD